MKSFNLTQLSAWPLILLLALPLSGCGEQLNNYAQEKRLSTLSSYGAGPHYEIAFNTSGWKKTRVEVDAGGYFKLYQPANSPGSTEKILLNYGKGLHTPLMESMAQTLAVEARLPCASNRHKVFAQSANTLSFITEVRGCHGGNVTSIVAIYKVFNEADGLYSISYSASPDVVSEGRIAEMKDRVVSANIVHQ